MYALCNTYSTAAQTINYDMYYTEVLYGYIYVCMYFYYVIPVIKSLTSEPHPSWSEIKSGLVCMK